MDELERFTKDHPLHLSIPKSQLEGSSKKKQSFLLLQLPDGCQSPQDLKSFVGRTDAALIVADRSYSVHRVETSNTLLLVPPLKSTTEEPPLKRVKQGEDEEDLSSSLEHQQCNTPSSVVHRLGDGTVSASFLELRRKYLKVVDMVAALPVWDPFDSSECQPKTIEELSVALQASEVELKHCLDHRLTRALSLEDGQYVMMTEQVHQICATAIVATLAEEDEYTDPSKESVDLNDFTKKSVQRIIPSEVFPQMERAVNHVIRQSFGGSSDVPVERVVLDWKKVAQWMARQLLISRQEPWEDSDFFITWQREMPGIDRKVHRDMLEGVAALVGNAWSLVPVEGIWTPKEMFETLFRIKDKWARSELQPYLDQLCKADQSIVSPEQLLIRFTSPLQEQLDGLDVTLYQSK